MVVSGRLALATEAAAPFSSRPFRLSAPMPPTWSPNKIATRSTAVIRAPHQRAHYSFGQHFVLNTHVYRIRSLEI